jgi:predicted ArsR family transcriptional regulator
MRRVTVWECASDAKAMSLTKRIRQLLSERPGLRAQQIANELGLEVKTAHTPLTSCLTPGVHFIGGIR